MTRIRIGKITKLAIQLSFTIILNLIWVFAYSQTINYATSNLNQGPCNLFGVAPPAPTVNTYSHYAVIGGVSFDGKTLNLQTFFSELDDGTGNQVITYEGTLYAIYLPLKANYHYNIQITVSSIITNSTIGLSGTYPDILLETYSANPATNTTICGYDNISKFTGNNIYTAQVSASSPTVLTTQINPSTDQNYLVVGAVPPNSGASTVNASTLKISKIVIQGGSNVSFTLPATTSIPCGSNTPISYTVTNVGGTSGVTGYTWNLGANNGWMYGSAPAQPTINTVDPTISLIPVCGSTQSNISATAHIGAANYTTNTNTVTLTQPSVSISGSATLCTSGVYSIAGFPCNATVTWTNPIWYRIIESGTGGSINATKVANGSVTLTATVTSCGYTIPLTQSIHVGAYPNSNFQITGNPNFCFNQNVTLGISGDLTNYVWSWPAGWTLIYGQGGDILVLKAPTGSPTATISATYNDICGTPLSSSKTITYSPSACPGAYDPRFTYSPNPAPSYLNVAVASSYLGTVWIRGVRLVSSSGTTFYNQSYAAGAITNTTISMTPYPPGIYTLGVFDGTNWSNYTVSTLELPNFININNLI